jgi:tetratricopeptide (TPR) repeat protein
MLRLGRIEQAMELGLETLELARNAGDRRQLGRVLTSLGVTAFEQKEPANAESYLVEALDIAHELKDRSLQTRALHNLALFELHVNGDPGRAHEYYRQALTISRAIGDRNSEVFNGGNLGVTAGMQGNFSEAKEYLEQSLVAALEIGDRYSEIFIYVNLSANAVTLHQPASALEYAQKAVTTSHKTGELNGESWGWFYLGHAQLLMENIEQARSSFQRSLEIRERLGQTTISMEPLAGLVEVGLHSGDLDFAAQHAEKILAHLEGGGRLHGTDDPLRVYYTCYRLLDKKQDPRATHVLQAGLQLLEEYLSKLKDAHARAMYIENVPWRLALWRSGKTETD